MSNRTLIEELEAEAEVSGYRDIMIRAAAALKAQEWQPIETPIINKLLDLWSPTTHTYAVRGRFWEDDGWRDDENHAPIFPTHWRQLPAPPDAEKAPPA